MKWSTALATLVLTCLAGCSAFDAGITVSSKPQACAQLCFAGLGSVGAGSFDGHVVGMAEGKVGLIKHSTKEVQCEDGVCLLPSAKTGRASCLHYLHLGWLGLMFNLHPGAIVKSVVAEPEVSVKVPEDARPVLPPAPGQTSFVVSLLQGIGAAVAAVALCFGTAWLIIMGIPRLVRKLRKKP